VTFGDTGEEYASDTLVQRQLRTRKDRVMTQYRQGDVLLVRVPETVVRQAGRRLRIDARARVDGRLILAYGEATGHAHAIDAPTAELLEASDGRRFLRTPERCRLAHEEHDAIELGAGWYELIRQREYEPWLLSVDVHD